MTRGDLSGAGPASSRRRRPPSGTSRGGAFRGGAFRGGTFRGGAFRGGAFRGGAAALTLALLVGACAGPDEPADEPVPASVPDAPAPGPEADVAPDGDAADADAPDADPAGEVGPATGTQDDLEPEEPAVDPAEVGADELGLVPVLMYHQLRDDGGSVYDMTPDEFRADLTELFEAGYRPVTSLDLVRGEFDIPAGTSPVVLSFDDSVRSQAYLDEDGEIHPDSSIGILIDVASEFEDVDPVASLYLITSSLFGGTADGPDIVRALHDAGMELGNHTHNHPNLSTIPAAQVRDELALATASIRELVPDAEVATLALPLGVFPEDRELIAGGQGESGPYDIEAALLVGAHPAPSPFHVDFEPLALPRILTLRDPDEVQGSAWWLDRLEEADTYRRYVSDGNPATISFPAAREGELAPALQSRANPY